MPVFRVSQFTAKRRLARTESLLNALSGRWQWLPNALSGCRMISVPGLPNDISVVAEFSQWPVAVVPNALSGRWQCGCRMISGVAESQSVVAE